jgi:hypothetical protein
MKEIVKISGIDLPRELFEASNRSHELRYNDETGVVEESIFGVLLEDITLDDVSNIAGVETTESLTVVA